MGGTFSQKWLAVPTHKTSSSTAGQEPTQWHAHTPRRPDGPLCHNVIIAIRHQERDPTLRQIPCLRKREGLQQMLLQCGRIGQQLAVGELLGLGGIVDGDVVGASLGMLLGRAEEGQLRQRCQCGRALSFKDVSRIGALSAEEGLYVCLYLTSTAMRMAGPVLPLR